MGAGHHTSVQTYDDNLTWLDVDRDRDFGRTPRYHWLANGYYLYIPTVMGGGDANFHHGRGHGVWMWYYYCLSQGSISFKDMEFLRIGFSRVLPSYYDFFSEALSPQKSATKNRLHPPD